LVRLSNRLNHRAIRAYVEAEIDGCHQCRSSDTDFLVSDILDSLKVPDKDRRYTCRRLFCPLCEAPQREGSWVIRCDAEERRHRRFVVRCKVKYGTQLNDFERYLCHFPSLGMQRRIGKSIWRAVSKFPAGTIRQERFVRVRRFDEHSKLAQIKREDMGPPDPLRCHIPGGRFNHEGQSFLYLSSDKETGIAETFDRPESGTYAPTGTCAIQGFEVRNLERVLDLTQGDNPSLLYTALVHEGTLQQDVAHSSSWKPEYLVPRFVADAARAKGFKAILYRTCKVFFAQGLNLVVFHPKPEENPSSGESALMEGSIVETDDLTVWERIARDDIGFAVIPRDDLNASLASRK